MYLNRLNKEQKYLFRDMCIHLSNSNGEFIEKEKALLSAYCDEMQIEYSIIADNNNIDDTMHKLVDISSYLEKRIIGFELMGIIYSDGVFQKDEKNIMEKFSSISGIPMSDLEKMGELVMRVYQLNSDIESLVINV